MDKKGQVTIFIIIGIIAVIATGIFFVLQSFQLEQQRPDLARILGEIPSEARPVYEFIFECIELKAKDPINVMGVQGGYLFLPGTYLSTEYSDIGYGIFEGENTFISLMEMEFQLESYMESVVTDCINTSGFEVQGYLLTPLGGDVKVQILPNQIVMNIGTEVEVQRRDFKTIIKDFNIKLDSRLGEIHSISELIIENAMGDLDFIDITFPSQFDFETSIISVDEENFFYSIQDNKIKLDENPYTFLLAFKYLKTFAPVLVLPDKLELKDSEPFNYTIKVEDEDSDTFIFEDDSIFFDIINGSIDFVPEIRGRFNITIIVYDEKENYDRKTVIFEVR